MGHPGYRMPIAGVELGKGPHKTRRSQTIFDVSVFCDIAGVVKINEIKFLYLPKNNKCRNNEEKANDFSSMFSSENCYEAIPRDVFYFIH